MVATRTKRLVEICELRTALEQILDGHPRGCRRVRRVSRRRCAYSSSYAIDNLAVEFDGGPALRLVHKDLSPGSVMSAAQGVRPHFIYEPRREIATYANVLARERWGTPIYYGSLVSADLKRYWLFLERVAGVPLSQTGEIEAWEEAARWLARMHAAFEGGRVLGQDSSLTPLLRYGEDYFRIWMKRAEKILRHRLANEPHEIRQRFARLVEGYPEVVQRLVALPVTFIHGEFYPSNVLVRSGEGRGRICPVDWELAAVGPGLIDLAALTAGQWTDEDRKRMVVAYREALGGEGGTADSLRETMELIDCCRLHLAIQLLGWAADWEPPENHAHNWLREALGSAGRLGIA